MSLLPRLHHHDIMTIVELFFILTIVELLHRATTKFSCHTFNTEKKKERRKKSYSLALALTLALTLTLTATLRPDHWAKMHCWHCSANSLPLTHQHYATYCNKRFVYEEWPHNSHYIIMMQWWHGEPLHLTRTNSLFPRVTRCERCYCIHGSRWLLLLCSPPTNSIPSPRPSLSLPLSAEVHWLLRRATSWTTKKNGGQDHCRHAENTCEQRWAEILFSENMIAVYVFSMCSACV